VKRRHLHVSTLSIGVVIVCLAACSKSTNPETTNAEYLNLADPQARTAFLEYVRSGNPVWPKSIMNHCGVSGMEDTYRVASAVAFRSPESQMVEVQARRTGGKATSYSRSNLLAPPPAPGFPPRAAKPESERILPIVDVTPSDMQALAQKATLLIAKHVAPTRGELALDGTYVVVEFCKAGRYGFFSRRNAVANDADDASVVALANAILATVHEKPIPLEIDASTTSQGQH
jgi:hypothetical protein